MVGGATILVGLVVIAALVVGVGLIIVAVQSGPKGRATMRCGQCHETNRDDAHFCARCGQSLSGESSPKQH